MRKTDAERTLEVAVDAATIAHRQAKEATAAKDRAETLVPDPHKEMLQALAGEEERAHRASRPKEPPLAWPREARRQDRPAPADWRERGRSSSGRRSACRKRPRLTPARCRPGSPAASGASVPRRPSTSASASATPPGSRSTRSSGRSTRRSRSGSATSSATADRCWRTHGKTSRPSASASASRSRG